MNTQYTIPPDRDTGVEFDPSKMNLIKYILDNFVPIDVLPGKGRFNYMCHSNSVHEAIEEEENALPWEKQDMENNVIAMVMQIEDDTEQPNPITHFINVFNNIVEPGNKLYVDNTLGHWVSQSKFYLVDYIMRKDFFKVHIRHKQQKSLMRSILPWWLKLLSDYTT